MIDLAPNHKLGLLAATPILLGAGAIGYGEAIPKGLDLAVLGAVVVGPILANSRAGSPPPRLAHLPEGVILDTGLQNRGAHATLQHFARLWPRLGCPVIAQVVDDQPASLARLVTRLTAATGLQGFELLLPAGLAAGQTAALVRAAERATDLPLWVKLPLDAAADLAGPACAAGAVGLVVAQPSMAEAMRPGEGSSAEGADGNVHAVRGPVYGPAAFAPMLNALEQVAALHLPAALIAAGGIHTAAQVQQALAAGAGAVQVDSAVWVEPGLPSRLVAALIAR